jgi:Sulfotransferase domain
MKVIGAGFGRTGTMSLKAALERLGFGPCYHMIDLLESPERAPGWRAAVEGEEVDWDALLDGYEATVDWPGATFYEQLADRYPDAKVVLTERDPEAWYESTKRTIHAVREAMLNGEIGPDDGDVHAEPEVMQMIGRLIWEGTFDGRFLDRDHAIRVFLEHNARVKATVPSDRLLVHEIADGWEPIAEFLEVEAPDEPFPRLNDTEAFRKMVGMPALTG